MDNNYASCKGLLHIGIFLKANIDINDMKRTISYQVIGKSSIFEGTVWITIISRV